MPFEFDIADAIKLFPDFDIHERLTLSSFKAAFRATDPDGLDVCLKIISPEFPSDRVQREIQAMVSLEHDNVAKLVSYSFQTDKAQSLHYMTEEFVTGADLTASLGEAWETERVVSVFGQLCSALDAMREANLVHRDLKPSNIRLREDDTPVIIDLGIARHLSKPDLTATAAGARIGTPRYFAPEQFRGKKHDIEHRTDLFALGIILFYAATGYHPFDPDAEMDEAELEEAICDQADHLAMDAFLLLPDRLQILVAKLLARSRADRPSKAAQVAKLLLKLGDD